MTDEQIIKALHETIAECYHHERDYAMGVNVDLLCGIDSLINRQKAEIDTLYKIGKKSDEEISELNSELAKKQSLEESFSKTMKQFDKRLAKTVRLERAEAIKEFAERVKAIVTINNTDDGYLDYAADYTCLMEDIDSLVKEMTEANKMRDIIFRGKRVDNGEWVYGDLIQITGERKFIVNNKHGACIDATGNFINTEAPFVCEAIPETVGQYTGLTDKNGTKIFEDDIAMFDGGDIVYIGFVDGVYRLFNKNGRYTVSVHNHYAYIEIIGNIHDNNLEDFEDGR